jgi:hypothetical protein
MRTGIVLATVLAAALALPALEARAADCSGLDAKISAAKTAADHEAIAACYDDMAKDAQAKATVHKEMGAAYRKAGGPAVGKLGLPQHCDYFTKTFTDEAKTYEEMAKAHRQMAKDAK